MIEMLMKLDYTPFWISFKLSLITTLILFVLILPLAYFMAYRDFKGKYALEAVISLPLVLPPSVLGFYLLVFLSPYSFFGKFFDENFGIRLVFNFSGLVIASCIYSLPFMFQPLPGETEETWQDDFKRATFFTEESFEYFKILRDEAFCDYLAYSSFTESLQPRLISMTRGNSSIAETVEALAEKMQSSLDSFYNNYLD